MAWKINRVIIWCLVAVLATVVLGSSYLLFVATDAVKFPFTSQVTYEEPPDGGKEWKRAENPLSEEEEAALQARLDQRLEDYKTEAGPPTSSLCAPGTICSYPTYYSEGAKERWTCCSSGVQV
jgi:hypothetical protein